MDWEAWREEFPGLAERTYLNSCSLGAQSRRARDAVTEFLDLWRTLGASAWYEIWLGKLADTRRTFARIVNAREDEIALLPNVSSALGVIASALPPEGEVATAALDFPTIAYQWRVKPGARVVTVPSEDGVTVTRDAWASAVTDRTGIVATSHVFYTTGFVQDVREVTRLAHAHDAVSLIDAYQGTGQLPTDVRAIGCDALVTGGLKWLLGGPGIAYLYVKRERHEEWTPTTTGWFAHADQFAFDAARFEPAKDARRFEAGTPAVAAAYAGHAGLTIVDEIGPARIRERTRALVDDLADRLTEAGFALATPRDPAARAGILPVIVQDAKRVVAKLAERGIIVDARPGRVRVSPYFYNTLEENARFVDALREVAPPRA